MNMGERYTFGKTERLKKRDDVKSLFGQGSSFNVFPIKVFWRLAAEPGLQAGVGVSAALFKRSTNRNRIKRLMREGYRLQKNELQDIVAKTGKGLHLFFIYRGNELPEFQTVFEKIGSALSRLKNEIDAQTKQDN